MPQRGAGGGRPEASRRRPHSLENKSSQGCPQASMRWLAGACGRFWVPCRKKAVQHGEAMRIRQVKDKLANVRRDIKEKRLRREEVDFEAVLAGCPEFKLGCDPMEFSEIGSPPPRDRIAMCALLFLGLVQLRSSLRLRV
ncbi:unnamed protein product [Prorocentrum cordatum]|uniref:Uncharacterized protein n=1 Tax=Prorocentrum cordatum TaxID=2364126 RepID=A0ABN9VCZ5_9DINO|nr:unnamed protein product [Polarella glacialis]